MAQSPGLGARRATIIRSRTPISPESGTLRFRRLEKDDGIEIAGVRVGEPFDPGGLPLIKIRARRGQAYLEMAIL